MSKQTRLTVTRRRLLAGGSAIAATGLAGCSGSETDPTSTDTVATDTTATGTTATDTTATPATDDASVETLVSVPGEKVPENMALGPDGALYFGITAGELRRVPAAQLTSTDLALSDTEQLASLPGAIGVETAPDGTTYVAVVSQDTTGVWSVPPGGESSELAAIEGFPNDIHYDSARDRLLVTESQNGLVYSITPDGTTNTWLDDDRLATESFGANGITRDDESTVYVAVTRTAGQTGRVLRVSVADDGTPDETTTLLEGEEVFGADGITARNGDIYVAANSQNRVVRVTPDGETSTVVTSDAGLVFPSDVLFGTGETSESLFVCNFANQSPEDGAILRATGA